MQRRRAGRNETDMVAHVAVVLTRNGYVTGQTVHVNGDWYMG